MRGDRRNIVQCGVASVLVRKEVSQKEEGTIRLGRPFLITTVFKLPGRVRGFELTISVMLEMVSEVHG